MITKCYELVHSDVVGSIEGSICDLHVTCWIVLHIHDYLHCHHCHNRCSQVGTHVLYHGKDVLYHLLRCNYEYASMDGVVMTNPLAGLMFHPRYQYLHLHFFPGFLYHTRKLISIFKIYSHSLKVGFMAVVALT